MAEDGVGGEGGDGEVDDGGDVGGGGGVECVGHVGGLGGGCRMRGGFGGLVDIQCSSVSWFG